MHPDVFEELISDWLDDTVTTGGETASALPPVDAPLSDCFSFKPDLRRGPGARVARAAGADPALAMRLVQWRRVHELIQRAAPLPEELALDAFRRGLAARLDDAYPGVSTAG